MTYIRLSQFRDWVKKNQGNIALVAGFILVTIIAFGAGRLSAPEVIRNPIIIEDITGSAGNPLINSQNETLSSPLASPVSSQKGMFVGSKNSNLYHWPWCASAKRIKPENEVWFKSEAEAKAAGRSPSSCIASEAPAGYKN